MRISAQTESKSESLKTMSASGMKRIDGGTFVFKKETQYDYQHVRDDVVVEPFWIDRSELSNRAVVRYLEDGGAPGCQKRRPGPELKTAQ